jgi:(+)-trans-carveol dehydrogenase
MGRLDGKVAFVTGAGRGQGRSHALQLAQEGADIVAVDLCEDIESVDYPLSRPQDLEETARLVEKCDRRITTSQVDVRDSAALETALAEGISILGRLDIVVANAGILSFAPAAEISTNAWRDMIDINLTGVYHTARAAIPHLVASGDGGSIVLTSSILGIRPRQNLAHYVTTKAGVIGLMRALAMELAPLSIRVNSIHPSIVDTPMVQNDATYRMFVPHVANPTRQQAAEVFLSLSPLPTPWVQPEDVSKAVLFLVSDDARFITGQELKIDGGFAIG